MKNSFFLFRIAFLRSILMSVFFLQIGIWVRNFAVLMFVLKETNNDAFAVTMISVAQYAPMFLFSFIGGTLADRWKPKKTMVICDMLSSLFVLLVLVTLKIGIWEIVYVVTLASSILSQFSQPSTMKLYKRHVPSDKLQSALAMFQTLQSMFMIIGPAVGAYVYERFGIFVSLAITSLMFLFSSLALSTIPRDEEEVIRSTNHSMFRDVMDGFRYILYKPELKIMGACYMFAGLAVGMIQPLAVFVIMEKLFLPKESVMYLMVASGVSTLLGSVLVMLLRNRITPQKLLVLGMLVDSISLIVIGFSESVMLTFTAQIVYGLFQPMIHIGISAIIVSTTGQEYLGRVNGFLNPLFMGMMVLMMCVSGWLKDLLSITSIYIFAGLLFFTGMSTVLPLLQNNLASKKETQTTT
ncbi:MFS transporter [Brevibacillus borstelensis]|jgi:MFS transporter, DHA3 family, macrolide efflux protein|uniref:MFS transporter n=1 Tax=Brevibacillus thermoruber TaxID=33942 RepID=A0A9X3TP73_9BACL|nr:MULTISPECIES: MFS transporter [Brevibacillus]MDA5107875.1 MFS transporter [Brevibacillus thermoruber]MED1747055.1 MFS transporter [Brevibacillus borstelensis]MED1885749.1 MFS transporter [Brevibacillus borstelensis]RNB56371.1 MFS transporter [Brevibacillus borstelensis]WNF06409.1 MFS transporter [Brevibacillus borstelensis]